MADDRLNIPKVQQGRKRSFAGYQQQIQSANAASAEFDAFASSMFRDAAADAQRAGQDAGRSAIHLNEDGTFNRLPVPQAGQYYMEAFADQQRVAHLSATKQSIESKTLDLLQTHKFDKDRDNKFQSDFDNLANTFLSSVPKDIEQDVRLALEMQGAEGARRMRAITTEELRNEAIVTAKDGIEKGLDKIADLTSSLWDPEFAEEIYQGTDPTESVVISTSAKQLSADKKKDIPVGLEPLLNREDFFYTASVSSDIDKAYKAGLLTAVEKEFYIDALSSSVVKGRLMAETSAINRNTLQVAKYLQDFIKNPQTKWAKDLTKAQREAVVKDVNGEIIFRQTGLKAEIAHQKQLNSAARSRFKAGIEAAKLTGPVSAQKVFAIAQSSGLDVNDPDSAYDINVALGKSLETSADRSLTEFINRLKISDTFDLDELNKMKQRVQSFPALEKRLLNAIGDKSKEMKKAREGMNASQAESLMRFEVDTGNLTERHLMNRYFDALRDYRMGKPLDPYQKLLLKSDKLNSMKKYARAAENRRNKETRWNVKRMQHVAERYGGQPQTQTDADDRYEYDKANGTNFNLNTPDGRNNVVQFVTNHRFVPGQVMADLNAGAGPWKAQQAYLLGTILGRAGILERPDIGGIGKIPKSDRDFYVQSAMALKENPSEDQLKIFQGQIDERNRRRREEKTSATQSGSATQTPETGPISEERFFGVLDTQTAGIIHTLFGRRDSVIQQVLKEKFEPFFTRGFTKETMSQNVKNEWLRRANALRRSTEIHTDLDAIDRAFHDMVAEGLGPSVFGGKDERLELYSVEGMKGQITTESGEVLGETIGQALASRDYFAKMHFLKKAIKDDAYHREKYGGLAEIIKKNRISFKAVEPGNDNQRSYTMTVVSENGRESFNKEITINAKEALQIVHMASAFRSLDSGNRGTQIAFAGPGSLLRYVPILPKWAHDWLADRDVRAEQWTQDIVWEWENGKLATLAKNLKGYAGEFQQKMKKYYPEGRDAGVGVELIR